jgi:hypothetical protein
MSGSAWRYAATHTRWRMTGAAVPFQVVGPVSLPPRIQHLNSLPRSAFDLPADRFGAPINLIDAVATAVSRATGQPHSVISPVGSLVYARDPHLQWDVVHDADIWCYVPRAALAARSLRRRHDDVQRALFDVLAAAGVHVRQTPRTGYVMVGDAVDRRERMVELKVADLDWLRQGLDRIHLRACGVRARRSPAYAIKPRLEWAAYSAFENHYATVASGFDQIIASLDPADVLRGVRFVYHENLAAAMRRFGPAHVAESLVSDRRLARDRRGVLKKLLMLSVVRRDDVMRIEVLRQLRQPATGDRDAQVHDLIAALQRASSVAQSTLARWLSPDLRLGPQRGQLYEPPGPDQKIIRGPVLHDATLGQHDHTVATLDRGQPVGDHQIRPTGHERPQCLPH